jgi:2-polyprenyl-3-methyl-5-hydroxy-6-metoxy-1,4-benzoquinol methylase
MNEEEKYTLLWDLPQGYGNNWGHPYWQEIGKYILNAMNERGLDCAGMSVLDIGGGDGKFKQFCTGLRYTTLDIAPNSGADIIADVSNADEWIDIANPSSFDWITAIDMLEHLPTGRVSSALENINAMGDGFIALISTRPDRGGKKIGQTLHMTVRPPGWWVEELSAHWDNVELLRVVSGEYCIVVCRHG